MNEKAWESYDYKPYLSLTQYLTSHFPFISPRLSNSFLAHEGNRRGTFFWKRPREAEREYVRQISFHIQYHLLFHRESYYYFILSHGLFHYTIQSHLLFN